MNTLWCVLDKLSIKIANGFIPADVWVVLPSYELEKFENIHDTTRTNIIAS